MTSLDESRGTGHIDAAFHYGGILLRAFGYMFLYAIAHNYDCGQAILTGVLFGDLLGQLVKMVWHWRNDVLTQIGELILLGVVWLLVRSMMVWPDDQALRAILGLAAFGVLSAQLGGAVLSRFGPSPA